MTLLAVSGWPSDGELTEQQFLDLMHRQKTLNFTPGDEFLYSNTGYALLASLRSVRRVNRCVTSRRAGSSRRSA